MTKKDSGVPLNIVQRNDISVIDALRQESSLFLNEDIEYHWMQHVFALQSKRAAVMTREVTFRLLAMNLINMYQQQQTKKLTSLISIWVNSSNKTTAKLKQQDIRACFKDAVLLAYTDMGKMLQKFKKTKWCNDKHSIKHGGCDDDDAAEIEDESGCSKGIKSKKARN
jgi:GTPase SAR1 family protein